MMTADSHVVLCWKQATVKCATCKQSKTRNRFYLSPKHPGGISGSCRTCHKMVSQAARDAAEAAAPSSRPAPAGPQVGLSMMHRWLNQNCDAHRRLHRASFSHTFRVDIGRSRSCT